MPKPPAREDAPQVETLAKLPPQRIEIRPNPPPALVRIHVNLGPIERVALRIVVEKIAVVRDPVVSVMAQRI